MPFDAEPKPIRGLIPPPGEMPPEPPIPEEPLPPRREEPGPIPGMPPSRDPLSNLGPTLPEAG